MKLDDYQRRKQQRVDYYNNCVKGYKQRQCSACAGSGYYDNNGSPERVTGQE